MGLGVIAANPVTFDDTRWEAANREAWPYVEPVYVYAWLDGTVFWNEGSGDAPTIPVRRMSYKEWRECDAYSPERTYLND